MIVTSIDPDGLAYESGIRRGDIVYSLGRAKISNVNDFKEISLARSREKYNNRHFRNGNKRILSLNLSK